MSSRTIDLRSYPMRHQPLMDWLTANGLEPRRVPVRQHVTVTRGDPGWQDTLTLTLFVLVEDGFKKLSPTGEPLYEAITVPLISAPENHGL